MTVTVCPVAVSRIATRVASSLVLNPLPCARATQVTGGEDFLSHIGRPSTTLQILNVIHFFLFSATIAARTASTGESIRTVCSTAKNRRLVLPSIGDDQA
jgi:hypothetical protein